MPDLEVTPSTSISGIRTLEGALFSFSSHTREYVIGPEVRYQSVFLELVDHTRYPSSILHHTLIFLQVASMIPRADNALSRV